ncbi:MAG: GNAT family N-acetyltransferase [Prevotella sp.]|nr:GNAT family N-acetyltransferase [Prevotella sp.]
MTVKLGFMGKNKMEVRYITPADDRLAISGIYEESWKFAYKEIIPQDYLDSIPKGHWALNIDNPDRETLICVDNGKIVGTSSFCKSRFEQFQGWGEVISVYLLPDYIGKGFGKRLMEAALLELKKQGYENVFLWVLEENIRARNFYTKFGFVQTDDFLDDNIGGKNLREVRYIYKNR